MALVLTAERKDTLKKYEQSCCKIKDLIRSITNNLDDFDEKYMKIKFNSDDNLPLKKVLELYSMVIGFGSVFLWRQKILLKRFLSWILV